MLKLSQRSVTPDLKDIVTNNLENIKNKKNYSSSDLHLAIKYYKKTLKKDDYSEANNIGSAGIFYSRIMEIEHALNTLHSTLTKYYICPTDFIDQADAVAKANIINKAAIEKQTAKSFNDAYAIQTTPQALTLGNSEESFDELADFIKNKKNRKSLAKCTNLIDSASNSSPEAHRKLITLEDKYIQSFLIDKTKDILNIKYLQRINALTSLAKALLAHMILEYLRIGAFEGNRIYYLCDLAIHFLDEALLYSSNSKYCLPAIKFLKDTMLAYTKSIKDDDYQDPRDKQVIDLSREFFHNEIDRIERALNKLDASLKNLVLCGGSSEEDKKDKGINFLDFCTKLRGLKI
jgi:hypothetical protein